MQCNKLDFSHLLPDLMARLKGITDKGPSIFVASDVAKVPGLLWGVDRLRQREEFQEAGAGSIATSGGWILYTVATGLRHTG